MEHKDRRYFLWSESLKAEDKKERAEHIAQLNKCTGSKYMKPMQFKT
jgi:hypothetical protein